MTDQAANTLTNILLIFCAIQILRAVAMFLEDWFYVPPKMPPIKTYYTADMVTPIYEDD